MGEGNGLNPTVWLSLIAASGFAVSAFVWLLAQILSRQRAGWISEVVLPTVLAGYAAAISFPTARYEGAAAGLLLAAAAGWLLDRGAPLMLENGARHGRGTSLPLLIWGAAAALHVAAPAEPGVIGWGTALGMTAGAALIGKSLSAVFRLQSRNHAEKPKRMLHRAAGLVLALAGLWVFAPPGAGLAPGSGVTSALLAATEGSGEERNGQIFEIDLDSRQTRALNVEGNFPAWSPDGGQMVFTRNEGRQQFSGLWVAGADGSNARKIATLAGTSSYSDPVWGPDGQSIYFSYGSRSFLQSGLWVIQAAGGPPEQLTPDEDNVMRGSLSPDGTMLAHFKALDFDQTRPPEVRLMDLRSRRMSTLVIDPTNRFMVSALAWTLDDQALIIGVTEYDAQRNFGPFRLERLSVADGARTPLGDSMQPRPTCFCWTADGSRLAMILSEQTPGTTVFRRELWLVDPDSGRRDRVDLPGELQPAWLAGRTPRGKSSGVPALPAQPVQWR